MARDDETSAAPVPVRSRPAPSFTNQLIQPLSRLRAELDRMFDDFPVGLPAFRFGSFAPITVPALEMTESDGAYKISAELPGMDGDEVEVTSEEGILRIAGEKKEQRDENGRGYRLSERSYGRFERLVELPADADSDKISAACRNGVLEVTIPRTPRAEKKSHRIAVATA